MQLLEGELKAVAELAHQLCGIVLDETKGYLVENRLSALVAESGCQDYGGLCRLIGSTADDTLARRFVDRISTGETRFFRDGHPYDALEHKILPEAFDRIRERADTLRILSAACSTGQEPVSLAMLALELFGSRATERLEIVGADVSESALAHARSGLYSDFDVERSERPALTTRWLQREDDRWRVDRRVADMIRYEHRNITSGVAGMGTFDMVFCRNVGIYFDRPTRKRIFRSIHNTLRPGGFLVVGSSEEAPGSPTRFAPEEHCHSILYRRVS